MTNHRICYLRDNSIVELIDKFQVLDTRQIYALTTSHQISGYKIIQRRMPILLKRGRVKLIKMPKEFPYAYYTERKPKQLEHKLATNWGYIYTKFNLLKNNYEQIVDFKSEDDYTILRADGFITIKNMFTNELRYVFVEADLSNNYFDKIQLYNKLYTEGKYTIRSWHKNTKRFPIILIITHRVKLIKNKIIADNIANLEFRVVDLDDVKVIPSL